MPPVSRNESVMIPLISDEDSSSSLSRCLWISFSKINDRYLFCDFTGNLKTLIPSIVSFLSILSKAVPDFIKGVNV